MTDDDRLPTSICCECSNQLQVAKSAVDKLKRSNSELESGKKLQHFQCRACLGPVQKNMAVNIFDKQIDDTEKRLVDVIMEVTNSDVSNLVRFII